MNVCKAVFPAGRYYVGDLCYITDDANFSWDEVCGLIIVGHDCKDGEFTLADGRRFFLAGTAYGDGTYTMSRSGSEAALYDLAVDSGTLGVFPLPAGTNLSRDDLGAVVEFSSEFTVERDENGTFFFGDFACNTGDQDEDEDDYYDYDYDYDYEDEDEEVA